VELPLAIVRSSTFDIDAHDANTGIGLWDVGYVTVSGFDLSGIRASGYDRAIGVYRSSNVTFATLGLATEISGSWFRTPQRRYRFVDATWNGETPSGWHLAE